MSPFSCPGNRLIDTRLGIRATACAPSKRAREYRTNDEQLYCLYVSHERERLRSTIKIQLSSQWRLKRCLPPQIVFTKRTVPANRNGATELLERLQIEDQRVDVPL